MKSNQLSDLTNLIKAQTSGLLKIWVSAVHPALDNIIVPRDQSYLNILKLNGTMLSGLWREDGTE